MNVMASDVTIVIRVGILSIVNVSSTSINAPAAPRRREGPFGVRSRPPWNETANSAGVENCTDASQSERTRSAHLQLPALREPRNRNTHCQRKDAKPVIQKGLPSPYVIALIMTQKFVDGLPALPSRKAAGRGGDSVESANDFELDDFKHDALVELLLGTPSPVTPDRRAASCRWDRFTNARWAGKDGPVQVLHVALSQKWRFEKVDFAVRLQIYSYKSCYYSYYYMFIPLH